MRLANIEKTVIFITPIILSHFCIFQTYINTVHSNQMEEHMQTGIFTVTLTYRILLLDF